jgi:hypothetical protein
LSKGIIDHNAPPIEESPADIWRTNRGIYLGLTPDDETDQVRPLAGHEMMPNVGRSYQIRSTWMPNGKAHLFQGEGHIAMVGPQGCGKSRKYLLVNLLKLRDWSCFVIDPKGELCAYTAVERAKSENHKVHVIDPFGVMKKNTRRSTENIRSCSRARASIRSTL